MSNLEMRHLESFLAVAEEGSFTRARWVAEPAIGQDEVPATSSITNNCAVLNWV
jgi:hypothetical protein